MEFWGTVSEMFKKDGPDQLPAEDDTKVTRLAAAMLIFFIVCIILLVVYLVCSLMLMYGSVRGSRWLILPWLVATFLFILAYIAGMCLSTVLFGITLLSLAFLTIAIIEVIMIIAQHTILTISCYHPLVLHSSLPLAVCHIIVPAPG